MAAGKAIAWGIAVSLLVTVTVIAVAFISQLTVVWPGILELTSGSGPRPETQMYFNPLAVMGLALLIAGALWAFGRVRGGRRKV